MAAARGSCLRVSGEVVKMVVAAGTLRAVDKTCMEHTQLQQDVTRGQISTDESTDIPLPIINAVFLLWMRRVSGAAGLHRPLKRLKIDRSAGSGERSACCALCSPSMAAAAAIRIIDASPCLLASLLPPPALYTISAAPTVPPDGPPLAVRHCSGVNDTYPPKPLTVLDKRSVRELAELGGAISRCPQLIRLYLRFCGNFPPDASQALMRGIAPTHGTCALRALRLQTLAESLPLGRPTQARGKPRAKPWGTEPLVHSMESVMAAVAE
eukprot:jgi/Ulvmu1/6027/UM027_0001.1